MSTSTAVPQTIDISGSEPVPFARMVRVELRKIRDTRAGAWLIASIVLLTLAVMVIQTIVGVVQDVSLTYSDFVESTTYSIGLLLPVLGIMLITGEWTQRTAMTTFSLVPHRARVIGAKFAAGLLLAIAATVVTLLLALICNVAFSSLAGTDAVWGFSLAQVGNFALVQLIGMSIGFALACLFLNTPAAIVAYFVYNFVLPGLFVLGATVMGWFEKIQPWIDFGDAQMPLVSGSVSGEEWAHLLVSGLIWLGLPIAFGLSRVLRAEVK